MNLPPLLFFVVAGALLTFGVVRAFAWGFRAGRRARAEGDERGKRVARRHLIAGLLWIGMGLFLGYEGLKLSRRLAAKDAAGPEMPENYRVIRTAPVAPEKAVERGPTEAPAVRAAPEKTEQPAPDDK